jgi:hypothetical protein
MVVGGLEDVQWLLEEIYNDLHPGPDDAGENVDAAVNLDGNGGDQDGDENNDAQNSESDADTDGAGSSDEADQKLKADILALQKSFTVQGSTVSWLPSRSAFRTRRNGTTKEWPIPKKKMLDFPTAKKFLVATHKAIRCFLADGTVRKVADSDLGDTDEDISGLVG